MNKLIKALQTNDTYTENGMVAHSTTSNANLDLFFKIGAARGLTEDELISLFSAAFNEDAQLAVRCLFFNRDIRGGQGERRSFRVIFKWLCQNYPDLASYLVEFIPEYGRFDDLFEAVDTPVEKAAFTLIFQEVFNGNKLAAKWMPREGKSKNELAQKLMKFANLSPRKYRKLLASLTEVVETKMCNQDWLDIKYQSVPSKASAIYDEAFYRHDPEGYREFLLNGSVHANAIFPVEVLKPMFHGRTSEIRGLRIQNQWDNLPNYVPTGKYILPICDVSGSMLGDYGSSVSPFEVCISLGIYLAERNVGPFQNCFIPFSERAQLVKFHSPDLAGKFNELKQCDGWGDNTDFKAVFDLLLKAAKQFKVPASEMPTDLIIFSDMQFDPTSHQENALEMADRKYQDAGYKRPNIIYWNLQSTNNVPAKFDNRGVALVSGYSPAVLASLFNVNIPDEVRVQLTPLEVMLNTLNSERYSVISV